MATRIDKIMLAILSVLLIGLLTIFTNVKLMTPEAAVVVEKIHNGSDGRNQLIKVDEASNDVISVQKKNYTANEYKIVLEWEYENEKVRSIYKVNEDQFESVEIGDIIKADNMVPEGGTILIYFFNKPILLK